MRLINLTNATSVTDPASGEQFEAGPDGVFDLPHGFATELAERHASQWRLESAHEAQVAAAKVNELRSPHVLPGVVAELRDRLERAEARLDALESAAKPSPRTAKKAAAKPEQ